jgi:hypothetical protein
MNPRTLRASLPLLILLLPAVAHAGAGLHVGASVDPDQFVLGGVYYWEGNPIPSTDWSLPVVELGLGDNLILLTAASDLVYRFPMRGKLGIYGGLEAGVNAAFVEDGDDQLDLALMVVLGFDFPSVGDDRWGGEVKIDMANSPDFKFLFTYAFGPKSGKRAAPAAASP